MLDKGSVEWKVLMRSGNWGGVVGAMTVKVINSESILY